MKVIDPMDGKFEGQLDNSQEMVAIFVVKEKELTTVRVTSILWQKPLSTKKYILLHMCAYTYVYIFIRIYTSVVCKYLYCIYIFVLV